MRRLMDSLPEIALISGCIDGVPYNHKYRELVNGPGSGNVDFMHAKSVFQRHKALISLMYDDAPRYSDRFILAFAAGYGGNVRDPFSHWPKEEIDVIRDIDSIGKPVDDAASLTNYIFGVMPEGYKGWCVIAENAVLFRSNLIYKSSEEYVTRYYKESSLEFWRDSIIDCTYKEENGSRAFRRKE